MLTFRSNSIRLGFGCSLVALLIPLPAKTQTPAPTGRLISRDAIAADRTRHKAYAVDTAADAVWVIDTSTQASTKVNVGKGPVALAVDVTHGKVYVLNTDGGTVSVVDEVTNHVVKTVSVGERPYSLAVVPGSGKTVVSNVYSDLLKIIDADTYAVTTRKVGSFDAIAVNAKTGTIYLMGYEGGNITALSGTEGAVRKLSSGKMHAWGLAADESKTRICVTSIGANELAVLNEADQSVTAVPTGALPAAVTINPATDTYYVANYGDESVTVIDGATLAVTAKVPVGKKPQAVVVDPKTGLVYVANTHSDSVTVIDGHTNNVLRTLPAGKNPYALALDAQTGSLYTANEASPAYTYIDVRKVR